VIDVMRLPLREKRLRPRIGKGLRVEDLLQAVQRLVAPGMFVQTLHPLPRRLILIPSGRASFLSTSIGLGYWAVGAVRAW